jgi:hypothetical protein
VGRLHEGHAPLGTLCGPALARLLNLLQAVAQHHKQNNGGANNSVIVLYMAHLNRKWDSDGGEMYWHPTNIDPDSTRGQHIHDGIGLFREVVASMRAEQVNDNEAERQKQAQINRKIQAERDEARQALLAVGRERDEAKQRTAALEAQWAAFQAQHVANGGQPFFQPLPGATMEAGMQS